MKKYAKNLQPTFYKEKLVAFVIDEAHCVKTWYVIDSLTVIYHWFIGEILLELRMVSWEK